MTSNSPTTATTNNITGNKIIEVDNKGTGIWLSGQQLNELGLLWGGRSFKSPEDIIKSVRDIFSVNVSGTVCQLDTEDLHAFKDQYASYKHLPYAEYLALSIQEAVAQYLWGSTKGILV